jgi:hypothetical protein
MKDSSLRTIDAPRNAEHSTVRAMADVAVEVHGAIRVNSEASVLRYHSKRARSHDRPGTPRVRALLSEVEENPRNTPAVAIRAVMGANE